VGLNICNNIRNVNIVCSEGCICSSFPGNVGSISLVLNFCDRFGGYLSDL